MTELFVSPSIEQACIESVGTGCVTYSSVQDCIDDLNSMTTCEADASVEYFKCVYKKNKRSTRPLGCSLARYECDISPGQADKVCAADAN